MLGNSKIKELERLKQIQKQTVETDKTEYSAGLYNGIELALAVLQNREPNYLNIEKEPEVKEQKEQKGRTIASGVMLRRKHSE